jgi:hypothetical protein
MELILTRGQAEKMLGGVKFQLSARVELKSDEQDVIKRYKADKWVLHARRSSMAQAGIEAGSVTKAIGGKLLDKVFSNITIGKLTSGVSFKCNDINDVLDHEDKVKEACATFYTYLVVMQNFGGEERISYPEALEQRGSADMTPKTFW